MILSRRHFLYGSVTLPALAAEKPAERPNILLLLAEGLPSWAIGCYGNREIRTPHIDRLAQMGTRLTHHLAATPNAGVNRGSLLTGRTPMQLKGAAEIPASETTLEKLLSPMGYSCSTLDASEAARYLDTAAAGKPFFLTVNLPPLRPPYEGAAQKYLDLYAQAKFDTFNPEGADAVATLRKAAASITSLDDQLQTVFSKILQRKLLDHTLVLFASASGDTLSHHGRWGSDNSLYEESMVTPMIWIWAGRVPAQAVRPELVSAYDLVPTLAELLTFDAGNRNLCGRSYALLATGKPLPKKAPWRTTVFASSPGGGMARVQRYKLVLHAGGGGELYALVADPAAKVNQFDNPQFVTVRNSLTAEWNAWERRYSA